MVTERIDHGKRSMEILPVKIFKSNQAGSVAVAQQSTKSYHYFMHHHLFDCVDTLSENIYIPIGTHLNWGSSHIVNDFYQRFVKSDASEKELARMGRNRQWF